MACCRKETTVSSDEKVTLELVKHVALNQSGVVLTDQFSHLLQSQAFQHFVLSLLRYFNESVLA